MKKHPFDIVRFCIVAILLCALTMYAFIGAAAYDEGMTTDPTLTYLYNILRFPTHTLFFHFFLKNTFLFFGGLMLNALFYTFLIERGFTYVMRLVKSGGKLSVLAFVSLICSCSSETKFDRAKWLKSDDVMSFPNRKSMIKDLAENVPMKGMKYRDVLELLGPPQYPWDHVMKIQYVVEDDFGSDFDPVYSQTLILRFTMDSLVRAVEVEEWKK
jgi:hypothetical protein